MKHFIPTHPLVVAAVVMNIVLRLDAQVVNDGATRTLINETNSFPGDVIIGTNSPFTLLTISSNALLTNSGNGTIGLNTGAKSNEVRLLSSTARWFVGNLLMVGSNGSFNRLTVSNGATVRDQNGYLGLNATASNNTAVVTGAGSLWTNRGEMYVGESGSGNQLIVSNGGTVFVQVTRFLGHASGATSNNTVIVTGAGSRWLGPGDLEVGGPAALCRLLVSDGGKVENNSGFIGSSSTSSNNLAVVTGAGSVWSNGFSLRVGSSGVGNQLVVSNGGAVVSVLGNLGFNAGSSNNAALVTGLGSVWSTSDLDVGAFGSANRLVVSGGGRVDNDYGYIGSSGHSNEVIVTDTGSLLSNRFDLAVGFFGRGNRLVVSNSGTVFVDAEIVAGFESSSTSNRIVVDGGILRANNPTNGLLDIRRGTNVLNAGLIEVNRLLLMNTLGQFEFNGGTLITRGAAISNGQPFSVGRSGATPALWDVRAGAGDHVLANYISIGENTAPNQVLVTNGARLVCPEGIIGFNSGDRSNVVVVAGAGSRWEMGDFEVGLFGSLNSLVVSNGGWVASGFSDIGTNPGASNNLALVTGSNSVWNVLGTLAVGQSGPANRALFTAGGTVTVSNAVQVGAFTATSSNNMLQVNAGSLRVTNAAGFGTLDIRSGTNRLDAGLIEADRLVMTNARGIFEFNGGKLSVGSSIVSNGQLFRVGNGVSPATLALTGNGAHSFANGLTVSANATLTGNGAISGILSVHTSGTLAPGASVGKVVLSNSPSLQGALVMEISKSGTTLTNDQIQVTAPLTYGGSLVVSNLGPTVLAAGDNFKLFSAGTFAGSFASLMLPPLNPGLGWTNKLLVDGSLEVIGVALPKFASITLSGTNVIISGTNGVAGANYAVLTATNITIPSSNWVSLVTNQFGSGGQFSFTNGIAPGEPQRYFRIRTP